MKKEYQILTRADRESAAVIQQFCQANGQILLPRVEMIESASQVVNSVIHEVGRQTIELLLMLSAEQVAGPRTQGKASGDIRWHGSQNGRIALADRQVNVKRPRLRHRTEGEVQVPAYESLRKDAGVGQHMLGALMRGVSTRDYGQVLPEMAASVGMSKSAVSRQAAEASAEKLSELQERRWDRVAILIIYIDGQRFGSHEGGWRGHRRQEAHLGSGSRRNRECGGGKTTSHPSPGSRSADRSQVSVRDRWRESVARGD